MNQYSHPVPHLPPLTVFDTETTGLDPRRGHRIVEIAGVRVENGEIRKDATFVSYVNPERAIPFEAKQINRISDEDVAAAPRIETVLPQFLDFARGSILVAHNAAFDMRFLEVDKEFCWGYVELPECLCSLRLSQSLYPHEFRNNLDVLCARLGVAITPGRHRALDDAILAAEAILKMVDAGKISSIDELRKRAGMKMMVRK